MNNTQILEIYPTGRFLLQNEIQGIKHAMSVHKIITSVEIKPDIIKLKFNAKNIDYPSLVEEISKTLLESLKPFSKKEQENIG